MLLEMKRKAYVRYTYQTSFTKIKVEALSGKLSRRPLVASYHPKLRAVPARASPTRHCCLKRLVRGLTGAEQSYNGCLLLQTATR